MNKQTAPFEHNLAAMVVTSEMLVLSTGMLHVQYLGNGGEKDA